MSKQAKNNKCDPTFTKVNRLSVLLFETEGDRTFKVLYTKG